MCDQCKHRLTYKHMEEKPTLVTPVVFSVKMVKYVKRLAREKYSVDQIKYHLRNQFPAYESYITRAMIITHLKTELNLLKRKSNLSLKNTATLIEYEDSIFIGEADILLKSTDNVTIQAFIMCAITSEGLFKLDVGVEEKQCGQYFVKMILNQLQQQSKSYQFVVKSSMSDLVGIQRLFPSCSYHTLFYYPASVPINPVRKYIRKLSENIPRNVRVFSYEQVELVFKHAEQQITSRDCKRWINKYLNTST